MAINQEMFGQMRPAEPIPNLSGIVLLSCDLCPEKIDIQKPFHEIFLVATINSLTPQKTFSPTSRAHGYYRLCDKCLQKVKAFLNER